MSIGTTSVDVNLVAKTGSIYFANVQVLTRQSTIPIPLEAPFRPKVHSLDQASISTHSATVPTPATYFHPPPPPPWNTVVVPSNPVTFDIYTVSINTRG